MTRKQFIHALVIRWAYSVRANVAELERTASKWADDMAKRVPFDEDASDESTGEYVELCQVIHRPPDGHTAGYACTLPKGHDGPMHVCGVGKTKQWPV